MIKYSISFLINFVLTFIAVFLLYKLPLAYVLIIGYLAGFVGQVIYLYNNIDNKLILSKNPTELDIYDNLLGLLVLGYIVIK